MKKLIHYLIFACTLFFTINVNAQPGEITGRVTDIAGQPLQGVTVLLLGTSNYTVTSNDGYYTIFAASGQTISFSAIGFVTVEVIVGKQKEVNIIMEEEVFNVEELLVVGYGSQSKRTVTSSIAKVSGDEVRNSTVTLATDALKGRVAGARIFSQNNTPGQSQPY